MKTLVDAEPDHTRTHAESKEFTLFTTISKITFFPGLGFPYFSLLCADVNCDFVLISILYCVILILILYCTTTYYYVLFHWRCMYVWYVLLNSTYLLTYLSGRTAPSYLSQLVRVADLSGRRSLRSARTNRLLVPSLKLSTVGGQAFPVAGPTIWNSLPDNVISAPSLSAFRQRLKHFYSRPRSLTLSLIPVKVFPTSSGSWSDFITWTTLKIHDCLTD